MSAILESILKRLSEAVHRPEPIGLPSTPGGGAVIVRDDYSVEIIPAKAERPGRRHTFADVESFAAFVLKHYPDGSTVEILADTDRIAAINHAEWFRDEVSAVLAKHPDFIGWEALLNKPMKQRTLLKELASRSHTLRGEDGIVGNLQRLDLSNVNETTFHVSDHGNFEIAGKRETTKMSAKLPTTFFVDVPVYLDRGASNLVIGLVIEDVTGEPTFSLRARNLDVVKLAAYRAEVSRLRDLLGEGYLVGAGKLAIES